ncbi:anti-sigma factor [Cellulomonas alba]|uniref:Regulator of SigK n=1 Tax=Cellulomonas alba TaxID=3053467 RepID=A0ABT7SFV5_9CELL|nr:anti-sigma factor [Cellulomonas alba]MDM7855083.1 anti-sigma factor [Cellulomonas alba]
MSEDDELARDLLAAYALDAVDDDERRAVERLLATDPTAVRELAGFREVAARLAATSATPPPPQLRADVLAAARRTPQVEPEAPQAEPRAPRPATVTPLDSRRRTPVRWVAIAAAFVVGAAIPTAIAVQQAHRLDHVEQQQAALAGLLSDPSASVVHGDVSGGGQATAVVTGDRALFAVTDLPEPAPGHVYQLWVLADGTPRSAGLMPDGGDQHALVADGFSAGDSLAMTLEPAGGSPQPTTAPLVVLSA